MADVFGLVMGALLLRQGKPDRTGVLRRLRACLSRRGSLARGWVWLGCLAVFLHLATPRPTLSLAVVAPDAPLTELLADGWMSLCAAHADGGESPTAGYLDDCRRHCLSAQAGTVWLPADVVPAPGVVLPDLRLVYAFTSQPALWRVWHAGFSPRDPPSRMG